VAFSLVTFESNGKPRIGLLVGDRVVDMGGALQAAMPGGAGAGGTSLMLALLQRWDETWPVLQDLASRATEGAGMPVGEVRLRAPLPRPTNLYCAFANYVDHMLEMGGTPADKLREDPFIFQVPVTAVADPGAPIVLPAGATDLDYEGELS
jgi:2-keto-4-pentenoate hydratase/2-oxohepta-3-ene-1,7-dioic acid hydratase in catechol pathway